jgi:hypothetical protein
MEWIKNQGSVTSYMSGNGHTKKKGKTMHGTSKKSGVLLKTKPYKSWAYF